MFFHVGRTVIMSFVDVSVICNCKPLLFAEKTGIVQNMDWTGLDSWTGQLDWTVGLDYWTGFRMGFFPLNRRNLTRGILL